MSSNEWCCRGIIRRIFPDRLVRCVDCKKVIERQPKDGDILYVVCDYPKGESPDRYEMFLDPDALAHFIETDKDAAGHENPYIEENVYTMSTRWQASQPMGSWLEDHQNGVTY